MAKSSEDIENQENTSSKRLPNLYPFKNPNFFSFDGRINRAKYFLSIVAIGIIGTIVLTIKPTNITVMMISALLFFPIIKRLHDMDVSGGLGILAFLPGANVILALVLLFKRGTFGDNKYGSDPLS
jgi:uncharacterized membrane protein YhaH (DUF805 family)